MIRAIALVASDRAGTVPELGKADTRSGDGPGSVALDAALVA